MNKKLWLLAIIALFALWWVAESNYTAEAWTTKSPGPKAYMGLSTETKPTGTTTTTGSTFEETNTTRIYTYNGSSWNLTGVGTGFIAGPDTTTSKASTGVYFGGGFYSYTLLVDVTGVGTNIIVYPEVKIAGNGWANANASGDSTVITTNGTFGWTFSGYVDSVRATVSAGSSDTAHQAIWRWMFGGQ